MVIEIATVVVLTATVAIQNATMAEQLRVTTLKVCRSSSTVMTPESWPWMMDSGLQIRYPLDLGSVNQSAERRAPSARLLGMVCPEAPHRSSPVRRLESTVCSYCITKQTLEAQP